MAGFTFVRTALLALGLVAASSASAQVVISQAYPGGTLSGATYNQRFIELFNRGSAPVSLAGHTLQYASPTGTGAFAVHATLSGTIPAGGYVLIAYPVSGSSAALPVTPDLSATGSPGGTNGKYALVNSATALACNGGSTACSPAQTALIVDLVGYGTANFFEGSGATPAFSAILAGFRANAGCTDTNNNAADFATATPLPRNSTSPVNSCAPPAPTLSVADLSLTEGNTGPKNFAFEITLSAPAPAGGVSFDFASSDGTATVASGDYVARTETGLVIAAGTSSTSINVIVNGDAVDEADETFAVTLSNPVGATLADATATGTILNDDAATAVLSVATPADIIEGNSGTVAQQVTVSLSFALAADVVFTATTADSTAIAGADYTALSAAQFTIAAGQTSVIVPVPVLGDTVDEPNETYTLTIASSSPGVTLGTATATATILDDDLPVSEIFEIQGNGACSPFVTPCNPAANVPGEAVYTRTNIVTAVGTAGFTMQTPIARQDTSGLTSNGVYVFTAVAPRNDAGELLAAGDEVDVVGRAAEFFGLTQIAVNSTRDGANSILTTATARPLPSPVLFGNLPPAPRGTIVFTTQPSKNPNSLSCGALGNFECFEAMRVNMVNAAVTVSNQRFANPAGQLYAEVWISPYGERGVREKGALFGTTLTPDNSAAGVWDGNPEIFEMDADFLIPGLVDTELAGGTRFNAVGVVGFDFGDYEFWPTSLEVLNNTNQVVRPVPAAGINELTIGSFNAFRLCDALANSTSTCAASTALETDTNRVAHQIGQISAYIRNVLRSPDVVGMQEVENIGVLQQLATQIAADGGPTYRAELIEGNDVGGIDVGYLINAARISNSVITQLADDETWNDPQGSATAILHDRPPLLLAADFIGNGGSFRFHVINNHTRSRGGVDVSNADGERLRAKRYSQAASIAALVQGLQTNTATAAVPLFVIGDHNAYQFSDGYVDVVGLIAGTYNNAENTCAPSNGVTNCKLPGGANIVTPPLVNLIDVIDVSERYSYKFTENFGAIQGSGGRDLATNQVLDHGLFNSVAQPYVTGMAFGRANVDASTQRFRTCNYTLRDAALCPQGPGSWVPTGSSDHDGFVIFISPPLPNAIFANGFETVD
ncbi:Calx-beta domain-containing protein [Aquimonas sp.]|jgi:predicted extracellular nuclease|uniref:Calx-beta domain-containing protein n=1 Tax=Aquimonas sp. TaxID=1872588 RepID=UPI0037C14852